MPMTQSLRVEYMDHLFNGGAAPTVTATKTIRLFNGNPDSGGSEVSNANGITRGSVTAATWSAAAPTGGSEADPVLVENDSGVIAFGTPTVTGTADYFEIHDDTRRIWVGPLSAALNFVATVPIEAPASQFDLTLT